VKEKTKKGGLGHDRFPPYPVGITSPVAQRRRGLRTSSLFIRWCDAVWPCFALCASVPLSMDGTCAWICVERELGGTVVVAPSL
jgi:hypothetical protein